MSEHNNEYRESGVRFYLERPEGISDPGMACVIVDTPGEKLSIGSLVGTAKDTLAKVEPDYKPLEGSREIRLFCDRAGGGIEAVAIISPDKFRSSVVKETKSVDSHLAKQAVGVVLPPEAKTEPNEDDISSVRFRAGGDIDLDEAKAISDELITTGDALPPSLKTRLFPSAGDSELTVKSVGVKFLFER